jgi:hypothetical protein
MYAAFVPANAPGTFPTYQLLFAEFASLTTVQPFDKNEGPLSKPPSPVGLMIVVCAKMPLKTSKERAKIPKRSTPFKVVKFFIIVDFRYQMYYKKFKKQKSCFIDKVFRENK